MFPDDGHGRARAVGRSVAGPRPRHGVSSLRGAINLSLPLFLRRELIKYEIVTTGRGCHRFGNDRFASAFPREFAHAKPFVVVKHPSRVSLYVVTQRQHPI